MTSLRWYLPMCAPGLLLRAKTRSCVELIGILTESNVPSLFEHNISFFMLFCYAMRRWCTSVCEQSICKVQKYRNESDNIQIIQCNLQ